MIASTFLSERRRWLEDWLDQRHWSSQSSGLRILLVGGIVCAALTAWQSIADLGVPPNPNGPSVERPVAANLALPGAAGLAFLGLALALPELAWRSWRE